MKVINRYFKFILWQDVEKNSKRKISDWIFIFIKYFFAIIHTVAIIYISTIIDLPDIFKLIFLIYGVLSMFTTQPASCAQDHIDENKLSHFYPILGYYNIIDTFIAPIFLFRYTKKLVEKENSKN